MKPQLIRLGTLGLLAIATAGVYAPGIAVAGDLILSFADPAWDGRKIPPNQHCRKFGGDGATPPIKVSGIPEGANAIIVEFNDKSYRKLSYDGGHGKVGFRIDPGLKEAVLEPVPGGTSDLPEGTWLVKKNRATGAWSSPGYLPPCSGGRGNKYAAVVKAVRMPADGGSPEVLADGEIDLGRY